MIEANAVPLDEAMLSNPLPNPQENTANTELKAKKFKRTSFVEILARNDLSNYMDSKRIAMNIKELYMKNVIDFLEVVIDKDAILDRRGLHLNFTGQTK